MTEIPFERFADHLRETGQAMEAASYDEELRGEVRKQVLQGIRDNFTSSASPENASWPERKNIGDGHPLLIDTGALMQAATGGGVGHVTEVADNQLAVGVDTAVLKGGIPYANLHNYGSAKMPQREFMGVRTERLEKHVDELIADAGLKAFDT